MGGGVRTHVHRSADQGLISNVGQRSSSLLIPGPAIPLRGTCRTAARPQCVCVCAPPFFTCMFVTHNSARNTQYITAGNSDTHRTLPTTVINRGRAKRRTVRPHRRGLRSSQGGGGRPDAQCNIRMLLNNVSVCVSGAGGVRRNFKYSKTGPKGSQQSPRVGSGLARCSSRRKT